MHDATRLLSAVGLGLALALTGCGSESGEPGNDTGAHTPDDGHGHGAIAGGEQHEEHGGEHSHGGEARSLGSLTIGETVLGVSISGDPEPNAELHVEMSHTGGPRPAAVRMWIGDQAATGALKAKAEAHGDHFEGHAEVPADAAPAATLWIEIETESGERLAGSLPLG